MPNQFWPPEDVYMLNQPRRNSDCDSPSYFCFRSSCTLWVINIFATDVYVSALGVLAGFFGSAILGQSYELMIEAMRMGALGGALLGAPLGTIYGSCNFSFFEMVASRSPLNYRLSNPVNQFGLTFTLVLSVLLAFLSGITGRSVLESVGSGSEMTLHETQQCFGIGGPIATVALAVFIGIATFFGRFITLNDSSLGDQNEINGIPGPGVS